MSNNKESSDNQIEKRLYEIGEIIEKMSFKSVGFIATLSLLFSILTLAESLNVERETQFMIEENSRVEEVAKSRIAHGILNSKCIPFNDSEDVVFVKKCSFQVRMNESPALTKYNINRFVKDMFKGESDKSLSSVNIFDPDGFIDITATMLLGDALFHVEYVLYTPPESDGEKNDNIESLLYSDSVGLKPVSKIKSFPKNSNNAGIEVNQKSIEDKDAEINPVSIEDKGFDHRVKNMVRLLMDESLKDPELIGNRVTIISTLVATSDSGIRVRRDVVEREIGLYFIKHARFILVDVDYNPFSGYLKVVAINDED